MSIRQGQKPVRRLIGTPRGGLVVARTPAPREGMPAVRVVHDRHSIPQGRQGLLDGGLGFWWAQLILARDVQENPAFQPARLIQRSVDTHSIVGDRGVNPWSHGQQIGELSPEAVADGAHTCP